MGDLTAGNLPDGESLVIGDVALVTALRALRRAQPSNVAPDEEVVWVAGLIQQVISELETALKDSGACLDMVRSWIEDSGVDCSATPPMFYPEALSLVLAHAVCSGMKNRAPKHEGHDICDREESDKLIDEWAPDSKDVDVTICRMGKAIDRLQRAAAQRVAEEARRFDLYRHLLQASSHLLLAATGPEDGPTSWIETRKNLLDRIDMVLKDFDLRMENRG